MNRIISLLERHIELLEQTDVEIQEQIENDSSDDIISSKNEIEENQYFIKDLRKAIETLKKQK